MGSQVQRGVGMIRQVEGFELVPYLARLLVEGEPVSVSRLAAASGWPEADVVASLAQHPSIEWDDDGCLEGFGLTLRPTQHRFSSEGRTVYGWCASDVLMFPVILGTSGVVEGVCAATGTPIRAEVDPDRVRSVDPPQAVVSEVRPEERVSDVRTEVCGLGHFFSSPDAAGEWLAANPEGLVNTVEEDFVIHRRILEQLGWVAEEPAERGRASG